MEDKAPREKHSRVAPDPARQRSQVRRRQHGTCAAAGGGEAVLGGDSSAGCPAARGHTLKRLGGECVPMSAASLDTVYQKNKNKNKTVLGGRESQICKSV